MSLNSNAVQPPITPPLQESALPTLLAPGASAVANQSEPVLLNPAKNNSSVQVVDELNRSFTPLVEHSAPEKSPRSTNAILAALPNTTDDSLENLKKAALSGDKEAQFNVGAMYYKGRGVEVDKVKAFEWCHKAAVQGHPEAQFSLGIMYDEGEGIEVNKAKAFEWCHKAAVQGHPEAQFNVAAMYDEGDGIEVNKAKALEWFQKAADQGDAAAQFCVAKIYNNGEGVEVDKNLASTWLHKSAMQGYAMAEYNLGVMYDVGGCVEIDKEKSFLWFHKAAKQNHLRAQKRLSKAYQSGSGVAKDLLLATYWLLKPFLTRNGYTLMLDESAELIKFIPVVLKAYSEFRSLKIIRLSKIKKLNHEDIIVIAEFIRTNSWIKRMVISSVFSLKNKQPYMLIEALQFNTNLSRLVFAKFRPSKEMAEQIEVQLTQNRDIAELRKYVKKHPLIFTADIPLDVIKILDKQIIVSYLKSGQTKEATKEAIDEFLMIARLNALAADSKIN